MENNHPIRAKRAKRFNRVALGAICALLLLGVIHEVIWYLPVTSYTYAVRNPDGHVLQHSASDNSNVASAIRNAFNQGNPASPLPQFNNCSHNPGWTPQKSIDTYNYTFSIWGIVVESVNGRVNDCQIVEVDSVLSPPIRLWVSQVIPYAPPPPLSD